MLVQLNGESREVREGARLDDLVTDLSLAPARIAIEVNHQVVRRDRWAETSLGEGDRIEIVHFVGGGSMGRGHPVRQRAKHAQIDDENPY